MRAPGAYRPMAQQSDWVDSNNNVLVRNPHAIHGAALWSCKIYEGIGYSTINKSVNTGELLHLQDLAKIS